MVRNRPRENLPFPCAFNYYGCDSTFASKNEWKRHVDSQHIQPGFYRCDVGQCVNHPIDINRKGLFTQHQRRMHKTWVSKVPTEEEREEFEKTLEETRRRCWHETRKPPRQSSCPFCKERFAGPDSWRFRMEHVGRHLENREPVDRIVEDVLLREWAIANDVIVLHNGTWRLKSIVECQITQSTVNYRGPEPISSVQAQNIENKVENPPSTGFHTAEIDSSARHDDVLTILDSGYGSLKRDDTLKAATTTAKQDNEFVGVARQATVTENKTRYTTSHWEFDDTETVFSETSSLDATLKVGCISAFVDDLCCKAFDSEADDEVVERVCSTLPKLLRGFSQRIGYDAPSQKYRDIMYVIRKNKGEIANTLSESIRNEKTRARCSMKKDNPTLQADIHRWLAQTETPSYAPVAVMEQEEQFPDTECGSTSETSADSGELQFQEYQSVIADTQAYQWLVGRLQREFVWSSSDRSSMDAVRHKVICSLPSSRKVHRRTPPDKFKVEYFIPWDPIAFVGEQGYNIDITDVIENAITLTGTSIDAQALTCLEYVKQTWTDGEDILLAIKMAAKRGYGYEITKWLPDSTHIAVYIDRSSLCVSTIGPADSVAEVGEQLAWLGGALRASPDELGVASFMPTVVGTHLYTSSEDSDLKATLRCHIDFEMVCPSQRSNGMCWHDIFRNPVVVKGYPTRHRPETNTGLETSLELLQELSQARYTTTVGGKLFLKGFSTLLVPARITGSVVVWHLYFNPDGSHISYVDARVEHVLGLHPKGLEPHHLQQARHILGWCAEAQALVGAPSANYDITWSGLEVTRTGSSEGMASIYQRRTVGATAKAAIGLKDRAEHLNPNEYIAQLMWIAKRFVVLYDVEKKQAWLTDGASALLHLVQASLKETETGDFAHRFIYRIEAIQKAPGYMDGKTAAITMLESDYNRKLRLYTNMDELFEDRVDRVYHALELALARQVLIGREGSGPLRAVDQLSWRLKGFDFMDVATEDCFAPREVIYPSTAPVWLELTEAIENVTLFGCGFGQLIKPTTPSETCSTWGLVPTGKDYLAACVSDIKQIMKRRGNDRIKPWRVVEGVFWHMPDKAFGECQCSTRSLTVPCSRVQVLVSHEDLKQMGEKVKSPALLADHGAVIFGDSPGPGHSLASAHQAPIHEKVGPYVRNDSPFYDSGIGTSSRSASSSSFRRSKDTPKRPLSPDTPLGDAKRRSSHMLCSDSTRLNDFQETGKADSRNLGKSHDVTSGCTPFCSQARAALPPASFLEISNQNLLRREEYRIGWISALKVEFNAALQMLDQRHQPILGHSSDYNLYVQGQIGIHNVVLTCLPEGHYGTNAAATVATRMMNTYPNIHIGFMVGIGGGLPSPQNDIRLGDVIVSRPEREHGGVVQYDMGKFTVDGFQRTGFLNAPPERLLAVLNIMPEHDEPLPRCRTATYPGVQLDRLFRPTYKHVTSDQTCIDCSETEALKRGPGNREAGPHVYYGTIASGNMVIKDAGARDLLVQKHGVLCFEMEAAGLMNTNFPCLVIRGVSDYADSHKNDVWKKYAAASAAEYARSLICAIPGNMYSK